MKRVAVIIRLFFFVLWLVGIVLAIYLFKNSASQLSDIEQLYSFTFFYSLVIIALSVAFLPVVFQHKSE